MVLDQFGVQNNLNTSTCMLLGNKAGGRADRSATFPTIGVPEPKIKKAREQMGYRLYNWFAIVTM